MIESVAFFRNLNLGQPRNPTRSQLTEAFSTAGATAVLSFQVNGTVLFTATKPDQTARTVVTLVTLVCGYADAVVVRSAHWVGELCRRLVSDGFTDAHAEVSVFDGPATFPQPLPWTPDPGRVTVIQADSQHAVSTNRTARTSYATPALERLLQVPVTSRGVATMVRLGQRIESERKGGP